MTINKFLSLTIIMRLFCDNIMRVNDVTERWDDVNEMCYAIKYELDRHVAAPCENLLVRTPVGGMFQRF